ncbi:MAG: ParB/RepB/Spo0J family partition protein, partial [Caulobacteraceae bacterium]|nr:ParB/RepB/Spo0J family partition protein [Caulobacteraceae bacterium]
MAERRGLGRGLSALLDETAAGVAAGAAVGAGVRELSVELVHRNPDQPRMDFSGDDLDTLAASIRDKGVLQPILVRPSPTEPGQFQIVAGERRWRAAQQAGLHEIPALVRELDDVATLEIGI